MTTSSAAKQELLRLLAAKSFRLGEFKLSSGGTTPGVLSSLGEFFSTKLLSETGSPPPSAG
jgi:hypothetical protein